MTELLDEIASQVVSTMGATPAGLGAFIHLPLELGDRDVASIYVEQIDADRFLVTDKGEAAARLALADVDFARDTVHRSWIAVKRSAHVAPPILSPDTDPNFEIATVCGRDQLGATAMAVAGAMVRAEGLVVLAPGYRAKTFAARIVRRAADFDLTVIPEAEMPAQFGGTRRVTCEIKAVHREVFTQALSRAGDRSRAYDHVRSLFTDAASDLEQAQKVVVIQTGMRLPGWQYEALAQNNLVINEEILDQYLESLVA